MIFTKQEAIDYIVENDVKFIKLQFCDVFGSLKSLSIMPAQLETAFNEGISFDGSRISGFLNESESELFLFPDPKTMSVLPWRPQQGRVVRFYCDIKKPDGTPFEADARYNLKRLQRRAKEQGFDINIGPECEFYLFKTDENGKPTLTPHDEAGFFDVAPMDKGENIRREICLTLEEMGLEIESSHHEKGAGQHEIVFKYTSAIAAADNFTTFKSVIKAITGRNGLYASFMPKPLNDMSCSGLHINISVFEESNNLFDATDGNLSDKAKSFMAGIFSHLTGMSAFTNPLVNSYKRLNGGFWTTEDNIKALSRRSQLLRVLSDKGALSRIELRSPDPSCNPYLVFALIIEAGLEGIAQKLTFSDDTVSFAELPDNLEHAVKVASEDSLIKSVLGEHTFAQYLDAKLKEAEDYNRTVHEWETNTYFEYF